MSGNTQDRPTFHDPRDGEHTHYASRSKQTPQYSSARAIDSTERPHDGDGAKYGKPTNDVDTGPTHKGRSPVPTIDHCESCESDQLDVHSDEIVCRNCGLVQKADCLDHGPEWREYRDTGTCGTPRRVGPAITELRHDKGLSTQISFKNVDANGAVLPAQQRTLFKRLRNWQSRIHATDSRSRNLKHALGEIQRVTAALDLPKDVAARAARTYRSLLDRGAIQGWSIEAIAAVAVYITVRRERLPITLKELETVARDGSVNLNRAYLHACQQLDASIPPQYPADFLPRIFSELHAPAEVRRIANRLVDLAEANDLVSGKEPNGVAGGAVYLAYALSSDDQITQAEAADAAHVAVVTIRSRRDDIRELLGDDDPHIREANPDY